MRGRRAIRRRLQPADDQADRNDGDQFLSGLSIVTPRGFAANLSGIPYCPDASIAQIDSPGAAGPPS